MHGSYRCECDKFYGQNCEYQVALVPAAAVIPALKMYLTNVAVKKLVVGSLRRSFRLAFDGGDCSVGHGNGAVEERIGRRCEEAGRRPARRRRKKLAFLTWISPKTDKTATRSTGRDELRFQFISEAEYGHRILLICPSFTRWPTRSHVRDSWVSEASRGDSTLRAMDDSQKSKSVKFRGFSCKTRRGHTQFLDFPHRVSFQNRLLRRPRNPSFAEASGKHLPDGLSASWDALVFVPPSASSRTARPLLRRDHRCRLFCVPLHRHLLPLRSCESEADGEDFVFPLSHTVHENGLKIHGKLHQQPATVVLGFTGAFTGSSLSV
ncbi:hypothetical protein L596_016237 [Steinernema carpocapsae]|uniref:Uncharacterized protein n=1 Tax=Steinernema carpocapsae TaxID=34508 RepID=A0A4U5NIH3_STECR|nr:hypothetical protein L596_016237 [Steinernema carpocapsae]